MNKIKILIIVLSIALLGAACTPGSIKSNIDGGIWVSFNKGSAWEQRINIYADRTSRKTIGNTDIKKLVFSSEDERKIFAITKRNGLWVSWNSGNNWDLILANISVNDIVIHPTNPRRIYAAIGSSIAMTEDEGVNWKSTYTSDDSTVSITSLVLNPDNPNILYAATSQGNVLISDNRGIAWRVYAELKNGIILQDMEFHPNQVNPESKERVIYAIASGKGLIKSSDTGKNWELFDISGDPRDYKLIPSGIIYASSTGLYRSLNFGNDWMQLPLISGKKDANIYALAVNPDDLLEIFYGARSTLYHSVDGGFNWVPKLLPTARAVSELIIHVDTPDMLYMGVSR